MRRRCRYLGKYVGKDLAAGGQPPGSSLEVYQGFQPRQVDVRGTSSTR